MLLPRTNRRARFGYELTTEAAASAIGWISHLITGPGLEIYLDWMMISSSYTAQENEASYRMRSIDVSKIASSNTFDGLELIFVLTDASYGNTKALVEPTVCVRYVGAICFGRDTVISIPYLPIIELNVVGKYSVCAICVGSCFAVEEIIHIDAIEEDVR